ncbi:MAG: 2-amino-4-hydroxy-6-hydroxymethyldihydropteridine diphosphokinase [Planctomycetaceae bacterium]
MTARCHIALGGNLGPVAETFAGALARLDAHPRLAVVRRGSPFRTKPVGDAAQGDFLNAAAELETDLPPLELLDVLQAVERDFGRTRERRWGGRTLDLDLVFHGDAVIDGPRLVVPHPACWYRRFVLDPLCEIAADRVHPVKRATVGELRARLTARPLRVTAAGGTARNRKRLATLIGKGFPGVWYGEWTGDADSISDPPTFVAWLGPDENPGGVAFESLPLLPRLDLSRERDPAAALRHVLQAALDEPRIAPVPS